MRRSLITLHEGWVIIGFILHTNYNFNNINKYKVIIYKNIIKIYIKL